MNLANLAGGAQGRASRSGAVVESVVDAASDFVFVVIGGALALLAFGSAYGGHQYLFVGTVGLLVASTVAFAGLRRSQPLVLIVAEIGALYLLLGSVLAVQSAGGHAGFPVPSSVATVARTTVSGWNSLLSTEPVVGATGNLLVIPLLCGMVAGATTMGIAQKATKAWIAVIPLVTLLAVGILFGTSGAPSRWESGGALALVTLGWLAFRTRSQRVQGIGTTSSSGIWRAAVVLVAASVIGVVATPSVPGSSDHLRYVLRDHVTIPFNLLNYPSPLSAYRHYVLPKTEGGLRTTPLFRVTGAPAGSLLRIATLDDYNGIVYNVAGGSPGSAASGNFSTVGAPVTQAACFDMAPCRQATITVADLHYSNVWLPDVGMVQSIQFQGSQSAAQRDALRYDTATDAAVLATGLQPGDRYSMSVDVPSTAPTGRMTQSQVAQVALPAPSNVPPAVHHAALTFSSGATSDFTKAEDLAQKLSTQGAYSDGTSNQPYALPGHGASRIQQFLSLPQPVGDAEQYATSMALMAQNLGLPARVVLGAKLRPGTTVVTGASITAWVEVKFSSAGWYPFFPTPPTTAKVRSVPPPPSSSSSNQAQNPNPPIPNDGNGSVDTNAKTKSIHHVSATPRALQLLETALKVIGVLLLILAILLGPFVLIAWAKARRRRRRRTARRPSDAVTGGWKEVIDYAVDRGAIVPRVATRRELADVVGPSAVAIAERADLDTFGPREPDSAEAAAFWELIESSLSEVDKSMGRWQRLRVKVNPRSLFTDNQIGVVGDRVANGVKRTVAAGSWRIRAVISRETKDESQ